MQNTPPIYNDSVQSLLNTSTPLLPVGELLPFVEKFFAKGQQYLEVAQQESLPLYLFDSDALCTQAKYFQDAFCPEFLQTSFYYAVKSNNHPEVARTVLGCGFGLDVSSGLELTMALDLGAKDIVFSGPGKTDSELLLAADHAGQITVLIDSFGELHRLEAIAAQQKVCIRAGVRLTTNPNGLWRKFGIPLDQLPLFLQEADQCSHIKLQGLQFHSSWNMTPEAQIAFITDLGKTLAGLSKAHREQIEFLDIGGGFWPPMGEWLQPAGTPEGHLRKALDQEIHAPLVHHRLRAAPIDTFAAAIGRAIRHHLFPVFPCRICFEPGRWLSNDSMHLLIQVVDKKGDDLVITDAGTNAIGWERFETDYFPVLNLTRPAMEEKPCAILGSLCTPHDVWGYSYWGIDIQPGDILLIPTQGAYTYSLRQEFIKPVPQVIQIMHF